MNGSELRSRVADRVSETHGVKKRDTAAVLETLHTVIAEHLAKSNTTVGLLGLGTLESVEVKPRLFFDGLGTQTHRVSAPRRKVKFSASAGLNRALADGGSVMGRAAA